MTKQGRSGGGFTLIEVLAVLFLTALVLGVALDFYVDLSNQSAYAAETTREVRTAATLLDRVAGDLERTLLVRKPEDMDPLSHPWVFVAESRGADGADRVKFMKRRSQTWRNDLPGSEVEQVAYLLREPREGFEDEGLELVRWSYPDLSEGLDREFPLPDDPGVLVLARGVTHFAMRFLNEGGEWVTSWDSSQIVESSELPLAAEIEVGFGPVDGSQGAFGEEPLVYRRRVLLPVRPLDLATLLDPELYAARGEGEGAEGEEDDGSCAQFTVGDCVDPSALDAPLGDGTVQQHGNTLQQLRDTSWCAFKPLYKNHPAVKPECR